MATNLSTLVFYVNGKKISEKYADPRMSLATYLRTILGLTGTKIGCNEGGCGACTVMISEFDHATQKIRHYSVNSCLWPVCATHGRSVTTVEGVGSVARLHSVQQRLALAHGSQCGFCTPGFVMAFYALLRNNPRPRPQDVDQALQGNLCRCTGYRPILEAFYSFSQDDMSNGCCGGVGENGQCCQTEKNTIKEAKTLVDFSECAIYDETQEPIFPPELMVQEFSRKHLQFRFENVIWYRPTTLERLLELKNEFHDAKILFGNSEIGVEQRFKNMEYRHLIYPRDIEDLRDVHLDKNGLFIGSAVSLTEMEEQLANVEYSIPGENAQVFKEVRKMLHWFAGKHIRNAAGFAGNIATASPISDLNPLWLACGAKLSLSSKQGNRQIEMDENFFISYRKTAIRPDEIIRGISIPLSQTKEIFAGYKQAQRREDDIAIVNAGMRVRFEQGSDRVETLRLAFGGMAAKTVMALKTMKQLVGLSWNEDLLEKALKSLLEDLPLNPGVPGGMERYRQSLCLSFFLKFYLMVQQKLQLQSDNSQQEMLNDDDNQFRPLLATQTFQDVSGVRVSDDPLGRPVAHLSGQKHTTGEALYCDDVAVANCLHLCFVLSTKTRAKILKIDTSEALKLPETVDFVDMSWVPENGAKFIDHDKSIFADRQVDFYCQPIGAIVAKSADAARMAAQRVKVEYEELPATVTIEDAIEAKSYHDWNELRMTNQHRDGEAQLDADWSKCPHVISGVARMGGQEHFYLETQGCIAIPGETDEMEIISSTQSVSDVQSDVALALGVARHKIVVRVKRIGGGFGGKETVASVIAVATAIAANRLRRPVKCVLERFDDMAMTGTRHPFLANYKVGFTAEGRILTYDTYLWSNAGYTKDLSKSVLERALLHSDNGYKFDHLIAKGITCRTNLPSNTAFRGFGGPQGMFVTECMMDQVAETLGRPPEEIRQLNLYNEGDLTHFGMKLEQCNMRRCWDECKQLADFDNRRKSVNEFNNANDQHKRRGIALIPTKFGIAFGFKVLNQFVKMVRRKETDEESTIRKQKAREKKEAEEEANRARIAAKSAAYRQRRQAAAAPTVSASGPSPVASDTDDAPVLSPRSRQRQKKTQQKRAQRDDCGDGDAADDSFIDDRADACGDDDGAGAAFYHSVDNAKRTPRMAGALVHIYTDGSVLVSHAGMEMGQGLHTKIAQIASTVLCVPLSQIHINDTCTDKVPNTSATAASVGSDLNGLAVKDACEKLQARLKPFRQANPKGGFADWAKAAHESRISLSATGFGTIDMPAVDFVKGFGTGAYNYCVYGTACSEVEIDILTGDHRVLRTDIVMDVGDSLNPAVDIGQIEGAFTQGYGLFTMEELKCSPKGVLYTRGPGTYKIPSADDAPRQFHVKLLKGSSNRKAIFASRAIGEPPLFLGSSVFFAIKDAIKSARKSTGLTGEFRFDSPATPERIRMACEDFITKLVPEMPDKSEYTSWVAEL